MFTISYNTRLLNIIYADRWDEHKMPEKGTDVCQYGILYKKCPPHHVTESRQHQRVDALAEEKLYCFCDVVV